jgi:hypothetical protein
MNITYVSKCLCGLTFVKICSSIMFLRELRNISYAPSICSSVFGRSHLFVSGSGGSLAMVTVGTVIIPKSSESDGRGEREMVGPPPVGIWEGEKGCYSRKKIYAIRGNFMGATRESLPRASQLPKF